MAVNKNKCHNKQFSLVFDTIVSFKITTLSLACCRVNSCTSTCENLTFRLRFFSPDEADDNNGLGSVGVCGESGESGTSTQKKAQKS